MTKLKVITYNMAMGINNQDDRRTNGKLMSKKDAFEAFVQGFTDQYNTDTDATWFICTQEINRGDKEYGGNQVDKLQDALKNETNIPWYKHSNTQPSSKYEEAVAIFSNKKLNKVQRWGFPEEDPKRVAVAVKSESKVWVVTAHPVKPESDINGKLRESMLKGIRSHMATFDSDVLQILCGDFNVYDANEGSFSDAIKASGNASPVIFDNSIGYLLRRNFRRGSNFIPTAADATFHSWNDTGDPTSGSWGVLDYILLRNKNRSTKTSDKPSILNFSNDDKTKFASDHKGLFFEIDWTF